MSFITHCLCLQTHLLGSIRHLCFGYLGLKSLIEHYVKSNGPVDSTKVTKYLSETFDSEQWFISGDTLRGTKGRKKKRDLLEIVVNGTTRNFSRWGRKQDLQDEDYRQIELNITCRLSAKIACWRRIAISCALFLV